MIMSLLSAVLLAAQPAPSQPVMLPMWLAGCWMAEGAEGQTEECWTRPRGTMLLGSSHTFNERLDVQLDHSMTDVSRTLWFEHMRIVAEGGGLTFVAQPGGAPPTRFRSRAVTSIDGVETLEFVNEANDYPQRITYRYAHARPLELRAEISMLNGSRLRTWEFLRPPQ